MPSTPLFPLPEGLEMTSVSDTAEEVVVRVTSHRATSVCPLCSTPSSAIHSSFRRKPLDLPCAGRPIRLLLTVKKFFCRQTSCTRKIFTERLPDLIEVSSRLTKRLRSAVQAIGFASCGKGGARLSCKLGITISDTTLLWSLSRLPAPGIGEVHIIGIDDFAWRKVQRYGSIIVDPQTHKILDVLPERTVESVVAWLFLRDPEQLDPQEKQTLSFLRKVQPVDVVSGLAQHFVTLLNERNAQPLSTWLWDCQTSGISDLVTFAASG